MSPTLWQKTRADLATVLGVLATGYGDLASSGQLDLLNALHVAPAVQATIFHVLNITGLLLVGFGFYHGPVIPGPDVPVATPKMPGVPVRPIQTAPPAERPGAVPPAGPTRML